MSEEVVQEEKRKYIVEFAPLMSAPNSPTLGKPVLVTTSHRGVFFGYTHDSSGETIKLSRGRLCIYWSAECKGFMGLASMGPTPSCRIGEPADIEVRNVTSVADVTPEAVANWEAGHWGA